MQYKDYGGTGKRVSVLGYGAMRLPFSNSEESVALLERGIDLGINYIDTAYGYGEDGSSERFVGLAIKGRRDQVYIATKNPVGDEDTPETWWRNLETSLKRLDTDHIDFYKVVHGLTWDYYTRLYEKQLHQAALKARDQGIIGHLAYSCHDSPEGMMNLINTGVFEGMLLQYNLLDRTNEEVIAHAHASGMGVEVMGPVGGGRLGMASDKVQKLLGAASTAEVALRFVLANPNVTTAFSGMSTRQQVEENCAVASREGPLTTQERQAIQQALEENERLAELYCTGCNYCMPCEQGVAIPDIFMAMNYHRVWGLTEHAKSSYSRYGPDNSKGRMDASACIECGQCEEKCPQKIQIIEQLKESHHALSK